MHYGALMSYISRWMQNEYSIHNFVALPIVRNRCIRIVGPVALFRTRDIICKENYFEAVVVWYSCHIFSASLLAFTPSSTLPDSHYTISQKPPTIGESLCCSFYVTI